MKSPVDLARKYLALADRDIKVFLKLVDDPDIDDEPVGFNAQQSVEKCLKAVLAYHQIELRRTHDLKDLLGTFQNAHLPLPPFADQLHILNPFAVLFRYEFVEPEHVDRAQARQMVSALRKWAGERID